MGKSKRGKKTKHGQYYALHNMERTSSCFILTLRNNKGLVCSVAVRPNAMAGIPSKDIEHATKYLKDSAEGRRVKPKKKKKALATLQSLTGIALAELSEFAHVPESGVAVIAADSNSAAEPFEVAHGKKRGKKSKGRRKGKKARSKADKKRSKRKTARKAKADSNLIPQAISRKLGKKSTRRIEKLLRSAIERELAYLLEQEARKWTRLTIETSGIGDYKVANRNNGKGTSSDRSAAASVRLVESPAMPEGWPAPADSAETEEKAARATASMSLLTANESSQSKRVIAEDAFAAPSAKEQAVLEYLREHPTATQTNIAEALYISRSTVADYTASLQSKGALIREGSRRSGRWIVPPTGIPSIG